MYILLLCTVRVKLITMVMMMSVSSVVFYAGSIRELTSPRVGVSPSYCQGDHSSWKVMENDDDVLVFFLMH